VKYAIALLATLFTLSAHAAPKSGGGSSSKGAFGNLALVGGAGNVSNDDKSVPNISLAYGEIMLAAGYKFSWVGPVLQASYRNVGQTTDPDSVSSINMAGTGYLFGAGLQFDFSRIGISAIYDLNGKYDLTKTSSGGSKVSYGSASGFHVNLSYQLRGSWQLVASFSQIKYKEKSVASTATDISSNPVTVTLYGAGVGYEF
jgi:hypothetical protein